MGTAVLSDRGELTRRKADIDPARGAQRRRQLADRASQSTGSVAPLLVQERQMISVVIPICPGHRHLANIWPRIEDQ